MNLIRRWLLGKELVQQIEQKALFKPGVRYEFQNGLIVTPADNKLSYVDNGYNVNDIIYSVVNIVLDKVRLPEWSLFKVVDESSLKQYSAMMRRKDLTGKDWKKAQMLKKKALEPIEKFNLRLGKLNNLITYPNGDTTWQDHITGGCGYKMLVGDIYDWGTILDKGANQGIPNEIYLLPSQHMTIKGSNEFPQKAVSYELTSFNQMFSKESILHEKYWNPNWSVAGEQLYGFAPLRAFLKNISRNNSAKESSASKFQNGGLDEIIYFDDQRFTPEQGKSQMEALKIKLAEEYSGPANMGKRATSGYKVGSVSLGSTPVELGIIDSEKWDAVMFCNGYGVPPELLGLTAKTYNNVKEAEKALTTRSAIPLLTSRRNSLNRKFQTDWGFKGVNVFLDYDTECFTELQTNMTEVVAATSKMMMITPNEEREMANLEARPEKEADEVWVMSGNGRVPLSDYQQSLVDQTLDNDIPGDNEDGDEEIPKNGKGKAGLFTGNGTVKPFTKVV